MLDVKARSWYRDNFLLSTEPSLIQVDEVNKVLSSDLMWWARGLPHEEAKKALSNSLCFGLYELPQSSSEIAGKKSPKQIGLLRLITDDVTFAYLTDVYVLPEYQGKGLGSWMLGCLNEVIKAWPHLRRMMLLTSNNLSWYEKALGAKEFSEFDMNGCVVGMVEGAASQNPDH